MARSIEDFPGHCLGHLTGLVAAAVLDERNVPRVRFLVVRSVGRSFGGQNAGENAQQETCWLATEKGGREEGRKWVAGGAIGQRGSLDFDLPMLTEGLR